MDRWNDVEVISFGKESHYARVLFCIERRNCEGLEWNRWTMGNNVGISLHKDSTYASSRASVGSAMNAVEVVQKHLQEILWNVIASNSPALA